jgi:hypothetical protein
MTHEPDHLDERLRVLARGYNAPPPTPREAMWARIEAERRRQRDAPLPVTRPRHRRRWPRPLLAVAATLVVGVGLGRLSARLDRGAATAPRAVADATTDGRAYQVAAVQHLGQAEVMLTTFRAEARSGEVAPEVGPWARDLLTSTRLLLDSPAASDPRLGPLLERLELVLAQIVQLPSRRDSTELQLIDDALEQGDVLTQLRTVVPMEPARQISGD